MAKDEKIVIAHDDHVMVVSHGWTMGGENCARIALFTDAGVAHTDMATSDIPDLIELLQEVLARSAQRKLEQEQRNVGARTGVATLGITSSGGGAPAAQALLGGSGGAELKLVPQPDGTFTVERV